jgi:hypothetical protein
MRLKRGKTTLAWRVKGMIVNSGGGLMNLRSLRDNQEGCLGDVPMALGLRQEMLRYTC